MSKPPNYGIHYATNSQIHAYTVLNDLFQD
jgi:hypothetical protein